MEKEEPDEVEAALAGLGSTLESTSTYEEQVIKSKTLSTAPKLSGLSLPNLSDLCNNNTVQTPTLISILKSIRSSIEDIMNESSEIRTNSKEYNLLLMKEQILISYLTSIKKMSEKEILGLDKREIVLEERKRSTILQTNNKRQSQSIDINTKQSKKKSKNNGNIKVLKSDRLNQIKNFGVQTLKEREKDIEMRNSCKKWRRKLFFETDKNTLIVNCSSAELANVDIKKLKEERIARRVKFRLVRQNVKENLSNDNSNTDDKQTDNDEEEVWKEENEIENNEVENENKVNKLNATKTSIRKKSAVRSQTSSSKGHKLQNRKITKVDDSTSLNDTESYRSRRWSSRNSKVISYCENSDDEGAEDNITMNDRSPSDEDEVFKADDTEVDDLEEKEEALEFDTENDDDGDRAIQSDTFKATKYKEATDLDDFEEWSYDYRVEEWIDTGISSMRNMSHLLSDELPGSTVFPDGLIVPRWIHNRLFPYQRTGIRWMWELHRQQAGGIVGDEMGLGKTVQICSYLGCLAASRKIQNVLIVSPATLLRHWLNELVVWCPGLRRILIHKSAEGNDTYAREASQSLFKSLDAWLKKERQQRRNEPLDEEDLENEDEDYQDTFCGTGYVVVTTYENIRRSADVWTQHHWNYVILDEGQKIRNPDADVTLACKRFRTPHRLLLSGTPIQNNLRELWSLFDFTFPGRLGTLPTFESEFADPMKRGGYVNASPMVVQIAYRCALVLRDLINPYLLRRLKKDIPEVSRMPGKTEQVLFCRLSDRQRSLYKLYLESDEVVRIIQGRNEHHNMTFRAITTLRKICNHPDLICGPDDDISSSFASLSAPMIEEDSDDCSTVMDTSYFVERSGKLQVLNKILPLWKAKGHKVLIFCQWTKMLTIIQQFIVDQGWKFFRMDGKTSVSSRQNLVDKYNNDPDIFVMLLTTRTGGVGLNLTGADKLIIYDPDWNPMTDAQARERSYRFGQTRHVTIYRLITAGTIEEKIYHRQIFKTALSNTVLQDPKQRRLFSQKDLRDLFTLKEDTSDGPNTNKDQTETEQIISKAASKSTVSNAKDPPEDINSMLRSKGLAGVFDHDFIDNPNGDNALKSIAAREMEEQASVKARRAVEALEKSVSIQNPNAEFIPTWTGSDETLPKRFGNVSSMNKESDDNDKSSGATDFDDGFGGAFLAGVSGKKRALSSGELLRQLKQRQNKIASSNIA